MQSVSAETAAKDKFLIEGPGPKAWIHNYIHNTRDHPDGTPRQPGENLPMIYLVDQEPNSAIQTHFHQVDQFQIVVGGSGSMGRHPLAPITVHYTSPFTGYGPLSAGPEGLQYLTIRSRWDPGLRLLPECKNERPPAGSYKMRQHTSVPCSALDSDALAALEGPQHRHVMQEPEGGASAWMLGLPPRQADAGMANETADRVLVVCSGSIVGTEAGGLMSCHYVPRGEALTLAAGGQGADILILQFPNRD